MHINEFLLPLSPSLPFCVRSLIEQIKPTLCIDLNHSSHSTYCICVYVKLQIAFYVILSANALRIFSI